MLDQEIKQFGELPSKYQEIHRQFSMIQILIKAFAQWAIRAYCGWFYVSLVSDAF